MVDIFTLCELSRSMLNSVDEVIEALGGPTIVASLAGVGTSAVSNWSKRGRISQGSFMIVRDALAALGKEAAPSVFGFKETATAEART
jgi:hypothetical protein